MPLRIPSNQIKFNYTAGKEYMFISTHNEYQGHYYELNGKIFAGKEFDLYAPELIKIPVDNKGSSLFNPLLTNAATYLYGKISKNTIFNQEPSSYYFNTTKEDNTFRYFIKKHNNIIIKEINKKTHDQFLNNPLYVSVSLFYNKNFNKEELDKAEKIIPGITTYISTLYVPGVTD